MPEIVATLKHGKVLSKKLVVFFWSFLIFFIVAATVSLASVILIAVLVASTETGKAMAIGVMAFCLVLCVLMDVLLGVMLLRDERIKREIKEWLIDAVKLKAYCEEFGETVMLPVHSIACVGNVKVTFKYKGDKKTVRSELDTSGGAGTGKVFSKFVNKVIAILYSPKFKQVMFLNEPCEQSLEILS